MLKKQNDKVRRIGRVSNFTWMVPDMGIVFLPKGFYFRPERNQWCLRINREIIATRSVNERSHRDVLDELIQIWTKEFKSNIANPDCGYMLAHHELGRRLRGNSAFGGVNEQRSARDVVIGYTVYCPHDNSRVYVGVREFGRLEYAFTYAVNLRERSMRRHEIALKYRGLFNEYR